MLTRMIIVALLAIPFLAGCRQGPRIAQSARTLNQNAPQTVPARWTCLDCSPEVSQLHNTVAVHDQIGASRIVVVPMVAYLRDESPGYHYSGPAISSLPKSDILYTVFYVHCEKGYPDFDWGSSKLLLPDGTVSGIVEGAQLIAGDRPVPIARISPTGVGAYLPFPDVSHYSGRITLSIPYVRPQDKRELAYTFSLKGTLSRAATGS